MGVCGVDQDVVKRNAGRLFDSPGGAVEHVAIHHQDVAGDERDLSTELVLDDQRAHAQLSLLSFGLARADTATDHHRDRQPGGFSAAAPAFRSPAASVDAFARQEKAQWQNQLSCFISVARWGRGG